MPSLIALAQSLGLAYAAGVRPYATILLVGLLQRAHWIEPLPGLMGIAANPTLLVLCGVLAPLELGASLDGCLRPKSHRGLTSSVSRDASRTSSAHACC